MGLHFDSDVSQRLASLHLDGLPVEQKHVVEIGVASATLRTRWNGLCFPQKEHMDFHGE